MNSSSGVPEGWKSVALSEIVEQEAPIVYGIVQAGPHIEGGVPYIKSSDVGTKIDEASLQCTSEDIAYKYRRAEVRPGDIVYSLRGNIGEVSVVPERLTRANLTQGTARIRVSSNYEPSFVKHALKSSRAIKQVASVAKGSTFQEISLEALRKLDLNLPPLEEQRKIAVILSTWDEAIEKQTRLVELKRERKRGLMQKLLTGRVRFKEFEGLEWTRQSFTEAFRVLNGKRFQIPKTEYCDVGDIPIIDQGQNTIAGYSDSPVIFADFPAIVFGDHTRILKWIDFPFVLGADGTQLLKTSADLDLRFGYYLLHTAKLPNLGYSRHMRELKQLSFFTPKDKGEQQKIAAVLSTADEELSTLTAQLSALKEQKRGLMQRLLTGKTRVQVA